MFKILKIALFALILKANMAMAVNIAVIAPKGENMFRFGKDLAAGAQIAVDLINENGGVLGEKIHLIEMDDRCEDTSAVSTAKMLSSASSEEEKLSLVIGPFCSNKFDEISAIYSNEKVIRITPTPLALEQAHQAWKGLFKIGGEVRSQAQEFTKVYKKRFAGKNLAVVYDAELPATIETALLTQDLFLKNGMSNKITLYNATVYNGKFKKLAKEILLNHQAVYMLADKQTIAKLAQKLQEKKSDVILFTDEYMATSYFFKDMGNFVEGVYLLAPENLKDKPSFTEELVKLRLAGKEPRGLGIYGYTAVKMWAEMATAAKSFDFEKVARQGEKLSFKMPWGEVHFNSGNASSYADYTMYQIINGEYAQVD